MSGAEDRPIRVGEAKSAGPLLSIGVFARRSRLSAKALRLYDRLGLLTPDYVDETNGYRWYRESQLATARLVAMLRRLDMPLEHVARVASADGPQGAAIIASYWAAVERRIASQRELAAHLQTRLRGEGETFGRFEIREREVPDQLVLTEQRHLHVDVLAGWLGATMSRLAEAAQDLGGVVGPMFAIYHGEVDEDGDGPVEVCAPISPALESSTGLAMRREPAHHEAYVRLIKAQVEYPQILSAFDAVAQWISCRGRRAPGAPREVYFTDWESAAPSDEVCDVAFPMR
ncbi:MAG TPA: MerR family transcriptional regulator [Candidatus Dormibacteraeota bacterium]|nr:MerR family transcriptional regulator [Candidatus Dormibacteraeota bacterium]